MFVENEEGQEVEVSDLIVGVQNIVDEFGYINNFYCLVVLIYEYIDILLLINLNFKLIENLQFCVVVVKVMGCVLINCFVVNVFINIEVISVIQDWDLGEIILFN